MGKKTDSERAKEWMRSVDSSMANLTVVVADLHDRVARIEEKTLLTLQEEVFHVERRVADIEDWLSEDA